MGPLSEQLKKYLEETPKEQLENDFFKLQCRMHYIDATHPNAKRLLKKAMRKEKWQKHKPTITLAINIVVTSFLYMSAGMTLIQKYWWQFVLIFICGSYFMYRTLKFSKELW
jgi:hypothetical protein